MPAPNIVRISDQFTLAVNTEYTFELPVLPLSHIHLTLAFTQPTANANFSLDDALSNITRISLLVRGVSIVDLTAEELFVVTNFIWKGVGQLLRRTQAAAASRHYLTLLIPLARKPYDRETGLPPVERGQALLYFRTGTLTGAPKMTIVACGNPQANPRVVMRAVRAVKSITATGDNDIDLALAAPLIGLLFRDGASPLTSDASPIKTAKLLVNNKEAGISAINRETLFAETIIASKDFYFDADHFHIENTAASYTQNASTLQHALTDSLLQWTGILFDTGEDLSNLFEFNPGDKVQIRVNSTTTGEVRVIPMEAFPVG
jgi:hypothetical protein